MITLQEAEEIMARRRRTDCIWCGEGVNCADGAYVNDQMEGEPEPCLLHAECYPFFLKIPEGDERNYMECFVHKRGSADKQ